MSLQNFVIYYPTNVDNKLKIFCFIFIFIIIILVV